MSYPSWQKLCEPDIRAYLKTNANENPYDLALKSFPNEWPKALILDQIKARQKAKTKLPDWYNNENIIYPSSSTIEQASSTPAALYKSTLISGTTCVDLTAGSGKDTFAIAQNFKTTHCIEKDQTTAEVLKHNINVLGLKNIEIAHTDAQTFLETMQPVDCVMIDPQRRNANKRGIRDLTECEPNILTLMPLLLKKAKTILIKTSPMLDITKTCRDLEHVQHVHVVEINNECKEVLYILKTHQKTNLSEIKITATSLTRGGKPARTLTKTESSEQKNMCEYSEPQSYIYEPGPAFLKAGLFKTIAAKCGLKKLHQHTHLYTSQTPAKNFPGTCYKIIQIYPASHKSFPFKKANISVRNFPIKAENLTKKLKVTNGGDDKIFACTTTHEKKIFIHCKKC